MAEVPPGYELDPLGYPDEASKAAVTDPEYKPFTIGDLLEYAISAGLRDGLDTPIWISRWDNQTEDLYVIPVETISSSEGYIIL